MTELFIAQAAELLLEATDLGWTQRKDGSYTRLLKFKTPVTRHTRGHLILALLAGDPPAGRRVLPGEHTHQLSPDGIFLRLVVLPARKALS